MSPSKQLIGRDEGNTLPRSRVSRVHDLGALLGWASGKRLKVNGTRRHEKDFAEVVSWLAEGPLPEARENVLVLDNSTPHKPGRCTRPFSAEQHGG